MNHLIGTANREQFKHLLAALYVNTTPLWGKMNAQQMVEHLIGAVEYTNGKLITDCSRPAEDAAADKQRWIYTDAQIPRNLVLGTLPENFRYPDLEAAKQQLIRELDDFDEYFKQPGVTSVHFGYGSLNHAEWLIWHGKHFGHHFKQFGLLPQ